MVHPGSSHHHLLQLVFDKLSLEASCLERMFMLRDTLKKAENAIVGVAKLLIFHDLESAARNYSVFPLLLAA